MTDQPPAGRQRRPVLLCAGTDTGAAARLAAVAGSLLAERPVVVLAVWEPPSVMSGYGAVVDALSDLHAELREAARSAAADAVSAACEVLDADGFDVTRRVVPDERGAWQTILEFADQIEAAAIVAGASERSGSHRSVLGREVRALAHRTRRPLLVLPTGAAPAHDEAPAIFAYDGSTPAGHAISVATILLRARPAIVVNVWQAASHLVGAARLAIPDEVARKGVAELDAATHRAAESKAEAGAALLTAAGWTAEPVAVQTVHNAATPIIGAAEDRDAAIIITGNRGRSRVAAALLGSNTEGILRDSGSPVLVVPPLAGD